MRMNLDHVASGHFVLGETFFASSIIGHCLALAVNDPDLADTRRPFQQDCPPSLL